MCRTERLTVLALTTAHRYRLVTIKVKNISKSFTHKMAAKSSWRWNYVTVALCIANSAYAERFEAQMVGCLFAAWVSGAARGGEASPYGRTSKNYVISSSRVCFHCHGTSSYHTVPNPTNSLCAAVNVSASGGLRTLDPL